MNAETAEETTDDRTEQTSADQESSEERPRRRRTASSESSGSTSGRTSSSRATKPKQTRTRPTQSTSGSSRGEGDRGEGEQSQPARTSGSRISAVKAVKQALEQFSTVTGRRPESVVGTRWDEDHWVVRLEVVESRRIPDTADLLAEYEVELDGGGELLAYSRQDRYVRGRPSE